MGAMPPGGAGGEVMVTVPKAAFDALIAVVDQLSSGLKQLSAGVEQQKADMEGGMGEMEEMEEMGEDEGGMPPGGVSPEDEEFLKSMVAENNARPR
jgi:hypothetical protein